MALPSYSDDPEDPDDNDGVELGSPVKKVRKSLIRLLSFRNRLRDGDTQ